MPSEPQDVIDYWLGDAETDPSAVRDRSKLWYGSSTEIDNQIRQNFGDALALAERGKLQQWLESPSGQLSLIILLDQFSRNLYRGSRDAWKNDARALDIATRCVDNNDHQGLSLFGRVFLYHPFHHAESTMAQEKAIFLFDELYRDAPPEWHSSLKGYVDFARSHRDIIRRFGRFPHRNKTLGRQSAAEEDEYLKESSSTYGQ